MHKNSFILSAGCEIEGGFVKSHPSIRDVYGDGSVQIKNFEDADYTESEDRGEENIAGEIASKPEKSIRTLSNWIIRNYPNRVNSTCGLHLHLQTRTLEHYALLMHKKFWNIFLSATEKWGKEYCSTKSHENSAFWKRWNGKNDFCLKEHYPLLQLKYDRDKYTHLNYQAYRRYKTLECRLFPAFRNPRKSVLAVTFLIRLIDGYLGSMQPNEFTEKYLAELRKYS